MLTLQQFQTLIDRIHYLTQDEFEVVLTCFPFENILNTSILDFESMRTVLNFLIKISEQTVFYKYAEVVNCTWEFTLTNLLSLENVPLEDILLGLLDLLKYLISRMKMSKEFISHVWKERERIFNILAFAAKLKIFAKTHVPICTDIINNLIEMNGSLPLSISKNLATIAEVYKELQITYELVILCDISFKFTFSSELADVCIPWLLTNGPPLLIENNEEGVILLLLKVIIRLYNLSNKTICHQKPHLQESLEEFTSNLKKASHHIIIISGNPALRDESLNLFSILTSEFFKDILTTEENTALSKLLQFPLDVKQWPHVKCEMFFHICHYLCTYSSLPWKSSEVINSISKLIYSFDRFTVTPPLLKSLCFIYPLVITTVTLQSKNNTLLGDDLLILLSRFPYSLSNIITYHVAQLFWILKRGDRYVKKQVLVEWLKRDEDHDVLVKAITNCKVSNVLLDIIINWKFDELASKKATELCHKIQDKKLLGNIALMIPVTLRNRTVLGRLILSNPGLPDNTQQALKICEFMSLVFCLIEDMNVLRAACVYSKFLITSLKNENNVVALFCNDMRNIQFLAIKVKYVDDETAVDILRLLKVLILVQKRNHIMLENQVEVDLSQSVVGSEIKVDKCLDLLQIIVTFRGVVIKLDKSKILNIFMHLFSMSQDPKLAVRSLVCLTGILKTNEWLTHMTSTSIFIEIQCSIAPADDKSGPEFLSFLTTWMKILRNFSGTKTFYLPDKRIVSNYIKRNGFISQTRVQHLLQLLNKIKVFNEDSFCKGNFYQKYHRRLAIH